MAPENADRDIELGRDDLAGLADLVVVGHEAGIDGRPARADRRAEPVGDLFEEREIVAPLCMPRPPEMTTRAEVSSGRSERGQRGADEGRDRGIVGDLDAFDDGCVAALCRGRLEGGGAHGDDLDRVARLHRGQRVAGIDRPHERIGRFDRRDLRDLRHVEHRRGPPACSSCRWWSPAPARASSPAPGPRPGRPWSRRADARSARRRRPAPWSRRLPWRAAAAAAAQSAPATSRCRSASSSSAAVTVLSVASLSAAPSCSAMARTGIR